MDATRARRLVEARLGRAPQDTLEAAVVLEAWAGVPAQRALETARELMPRRAAEPPASVAYAPSRGARRGSRRRPCVPVTVVAIALWAQPLADSLGGAAVERALRSALPMTLALQWGLRARHLGRPSGLAGLARERGRWPRAPRCWSPGRVRCSGGPVRLAALLTVTWTGGAVLIRRGARYALYAAAVTPATVAARPAWVRGRRRARGGAVWPGAGAARRGRCCCPGTLEPDARRGPDRGGRRDAAGRRSDRDVDRGLAGRAGTSPVGGRAPCGRGCTCGSSHPRFRARSPASWRSSQARRAAMSPPPARPRRAADRPLARAYARGRRRAARRSHHGRFARAGRGPPAGRRAC